MSTFTPYDRVSPDYDMTRRPIGSEIILGCLAGLDRPLDQVALLDAGCGTGAYAQAVAGRVGHIDAIDLSPGMLSQAAAKLADEAAAGRIAFHQGSIAELPFEDARFDAVMTNQVLHHLDGGGDESFPVLRRAIGEFARVLRPGGALVINTCSREQLRRAYWYWRLVPDATERYCRRFAPLETIERFLGEAGLVYGGSHAPLDAACQGEAYFDPRGPFDPAWRNGDSFWAELSEDELERSLAKLRSLEAEGGLEAFLREQDAERPLLGQITFLLARRPG